MAAGIRWRPSDAANLAKAAPSRYQGHLFKPQ
jgi:hypothetical protein